MDNSVPLITYQHIRADLKPIFPEWLAKRLSTLTESLPAGPASRQLVDPDETRAADQPDHAPRYEASMYGPMNASLTLFFPLELSFMVKPQPRIRKPLSPAQVAQIQGKHVRNISSDSYDNVVYVSDKDLIPDFIVCLGGAGLHDDEYLMMVEVKRHGEQFCDHTKQLDSYTEWTKRTNRADLDRLIMVVIGSVAMCQTVTAKGETDTMFTDTWSWEMFEIWHHIRQSHGRQAVSGDYPLNPFAQ
ncbi:uncharacterized protein PHACADRAFT_32656 [Phanerochaete carnosa HHB-10118-sp]|uniref:Fungal-type protein kinase domain-containing protein n=1 Tax=Phanerochaete carnosa (strain HHB-10118-sp) TaxID=650164 RepID=K5VV01_PHACS|nr:uncharacterized protein PHACADRAFT_32656 [Phanerochaete carnosa HHB-10118-sp]EKM50645.1 hypothetical protein PHACADRAFT_32656 [Phanerochaete carnosa HHB-10118-sp]